MKHSHRHPHRGDHGPDHHHKRHDRHHGGHRGRAGPGRFFDSNDLRFLILDLIAEEPRHGYEIIKLIESQSAGAHAPSPGIIYPTLTMLEEMGQAAVSIDGTRKLYAITDAGLTELDANRQQVDHLLARLREAGERHVHDRPVPIMRAMDNLKLVLRLRSGQFTPEQLATVTDIIDDAAKKIERL
ncbi:MAG: PadR family transcriptional regulator [Tepidisphaeraceae bacterium]